MASPIEPKLSIIIPARSDSRALASVIRQARLVRPRSEIIVVCNSAKDRTARRARKAGATKVIAGEASLGHDEGRSIGAKAASGDILLFLAADLPVPSGLLKEYVGKVEEGWDVALNAYSGANRKHCVNVSKFLLNQLLRRPDLEGASLTVVPHALSRHALNVIGTEQLSVPPVAHALAVLNGLSVTSCGYIMTSAAQKPRRAERNAELIMGDHAEAISQLIMRNGPRAGFTDFERDRGALTLAVEGGGE